VSVFTGSHSAFSGAVSFARVEWRWLLTGLLLAFGSSFGQTYFISLSGAEIRATFDLSHGGFGLIYTIATTASALVLLRYGGIVDRYPVRWLAVATAVALGLGCLVMAAAQHLVVLVLALFLLRLFGQGMMSHIALTAMGRWYSARRGRAVAVATLGFPVGEALWPLVVVGVIAAVGWRTSWVMAAALMILVAAPLFYWIARQERTPLNPVPADGATATDEICGRFHWRAEDVRRDWLFAALLPGVLAPAFMATAIYFHQAYIAEVKGWSIATIAASYPVFAFCSVVSGATVGFLVDWFSARRVLPFALLPLAVGLVTLALGGAPVASPLAFACFGLSAGCGATLAGTLWAELYGIRHLGAVRAMVVALQVFATALGPSITGGFFDFGVSVAAVLIAMAVWCLMASVGYVLCASALATRASGAAPRNIGACEMEGS